LISAGIFAQGHHVLVDEQDQDKAINQEVTRMAQLIQNRVKIVGQCHQRREFH
jgi:hypothetical protein